MFGIVPNIRYYLVGYRVVLPISHKVANIWQVLVLPIFGNSNIWLAKYWQQTNHSLNVERGAGIFSKIVIVCFLSVRYRSNDLYYKMAGTPSSPTRFFIRVESRDTSKMPMCCTEHQDAFVRVVYLVREKDERGKTLFANVERGVGIFLQNCHSFLPIRRI